MLVLPTKIFALGEPPNAEICIGPNASSFALQWNIGFSLIDIKHCVFFGVVGLEICICYTFKRPIYHQQAHTDLRIKNVNMIP